MLWNLFSKRHVRTDSDFFLFYSVSSLVTIAAFLPFAVAGPMPSAYTLLLGALFGAITAAGSICGLMALKLGPMSYTSLITTLSCVIPTLSGMLFWGEVISPWGWAGITLMLASFVLLTQKKKNEDKIDGRWLSRCLAAFALSGLVGVLQKVHQSSGHRSESGAFLIVAFAVSALSSLAAHFILRNRKAERSERRGFSAAVWGMALLSGLFVATGNQLNLYLAGVMDSAVFFPIVTGGGVVLSTVAALVLFGERMPPRRMAGLIVGIVSVLLVGGIFK